MVRTREKRARISVIISMLLLFVGLGVITAAAGAKIGEYARRFASIEATVRIALGSEWPPLTAEQSAKLTAAVKDLPHDRQFYAMYHDELSHPLAASIADAFRAAGWTKVAVAEAVDLETGLATGRGDGVALALNKAMRDATGAEVREVRPDLADNPGMVLFVSVGVRR